MSLRQLLIVIAAFTASSPAFASWTLDNESSSLTFVSIKAIDIAEVHRFTFLAGRISDKGKAVVTVELGSADTGIPIRNDRLQEMLFETDKFPLATVRAKIDMDVIDTLQPGDSTRIDSEMTLELHGAKVSITANMVVARLSKTTLTVSSAKPVILTAASVDLTGGIEALRKVANLPSISNAVPVSFLLTFVQPE